MPEYGASDVVLMVGFVIGAMALGAIISHLMSAAK